MTAWRAMKFESDMPFGELRPLTHLNWLPGDSTPEILRFVGVRGVEQNTNRPGCQNEFSDITLSNNPIGCMDSCSVKEVDGGLIVGRKGKMGRVNRAEVLNFDGRALIARIPVAMDIVIELAAGKPDFICGGPQCHQRPGIWNCDLDIDQSRIVLRVASWGVGCHWSVSRKQVAAELVCPQVSGDMRNCRVD